MHDQRRMTTILVTHNLHEAVFMSDRVVVLGGTPARIVAEISNALPRPREAAFRDQDAFYEQARLLTQAVFGSETRDSNQRTGGEGTIDAASEEGL